MRLGLTSSDSNILRSENYGEQTTHEHIEKDGEELRNQVQQKNLKRHFNRENNESEVRIMTPATFLEKLKENLALRKSRLASLMAGDWPKDTKWRAIEKEAGFPKGLPKKTTPMTAENMLAHAKIISAIEDTIKKMEEGLK